MSKSCELLELLAQRLEPGQGDERTQHVVGALEDREHADVAQRALVGVVAQVALSPGQLQRPVALVPEELGSGDLADRRLERVVRNARVDQARRHVGHRLQAEQERDHPADLLLHELELGERAAELPAARDVLDRHVEELLGGADRARAEAHAAVVEDLHRDLEAVAGLAEHVLRRDPDVVVVEVAQIVAAQSHRVVALADLEAVHVGGEDQRDVAVLAVDLRAGEGHDHAGLRAVADVALLTVEQPRAVGLAAPRATAGGRRRSPPRAR